jgi:hypothetical protein
MHTMPRALRIVLGAIGRLSPAERERLLDPRYRGELSERLRRSLTPTFHRGAVCAAGGVRGG